MSIWNKLEQSSEVLAVFVPSTDADVAAPPPIDPGPRAISVIEVFDPEARAVEPAPQGEALDQLCRRFVPDLQPGLLALMPSAPSVDAETRAVIEASLRIGGTALRDRPFAVLRIAVPDLDDGLDPDELADLAEQRQRLLEAFARDDRDAIDTSLRSALAGIEAHPGLGDGDRRRLVAGFAQEFVKLRKQGLGAIPRPTRPWSDFIADLPAVATLGAYDLTKILGRVPKMAEPPDRGVGPDAEPTEVHWNTRILDGDRPVVDQALIVDRCYRVASTIDPAPADDAVAGGSLAPEQVADGTLVSFVVQCAQPILRAPGTEPWVTRVEGAAPYDAATGTTAPVVVELQPSTAGSLTLGLTVITHNAIRQSVRLRFTVEAAPAVGAIVAAPVAAIAPSPAGPPVVTVGAVLAGPAAELRLELTAADQLHVSTGAVIGNPCSARNPTELPGAAIRARAALVALSSAYRAEPTAAPFGIVDGPATLLRLARIGADLHRAVFGKPTDDDDLNRTRVARTLADAPDGDDIVRLQIGAAFQPFPWAVFYDGAWRGKPLTAEPASVDPSCFWGRRFRIDRALVTGHGAIPARPAIRAPLRVQACLNPHLDRQQRVAVLDAQRAMFAGLTGVVARPAIESDQALRDYLTAQPAACDLLYFFCHATAAETRDDLFTYLGEPPDRQAKLVLDQTGGLAVQDLDDLRTGPLGDRPLVFLNACGSVAGDECYQPQLLLQFLARWKAAGVIGTDWKVPTVFADAFARRLMDYFLRDHLPLAAAFARASDDAFAQGNPFPLIYALYAPPDLTFLPGASS